MEFGSQQIAAVGSGGLSIVSAVSFFVAEGKNTAFKPKEIFGFCMIFITLIGIAGFSGLLNKFVTPYTLFIINQAYFLTAGIFFTYFFYKKYSGKLKRLLFSESMAMLATIALGMVVYILLFDLRRDSGLHLSWIFATSSVIFLLPFLYREAFIYYLNIPSPIYKVWKFPMEVYEPDFENIDMERLIIAEIELKKNISDKTETNIKARAPLQMVLKDWFFSFINDYNYRHPENLIEIKDNQSDTYEWQFFIKPSFFGNRKYLDPDLSITQNKIRENAVVMAERVRNTE